MTSDVAPKHAPPPRQDDALDPARLAHALYPTVMAAGDTIMRHYACPTAMEQKADGSPVSAADRDAEELIVAALAHLAPGVPVVAEEAASAGVDVSAAPTFFLVDPLDGTREFAARRPEFTVNVALVRDGHPVFGMILAPALGKLYWTEGPGEAFEADVPQGKAPAALSDVAARRLCTKAAHAGPLSIVASRSHGSAETEAWLKAHNVGERLDIGSSLKFCLVACGRADLYPRLGPTMEWDTAAGHAIACAAGASVTGLKGEPFLYGKRAEAYRNGGFLVWAHAPPQPANQ